MKSTGIVRQVDKLGRVVIPKELCRQFDIIGERDSLEIYVEDDKIILKKYQPSCIFCNEATNVTNFEGKIICRSCIEKMKQMFPSEYHQYSIMNEQFKPE